MEDKNIAEEKNILYEDLALKSYRVIRPNLIKLFTHCVLLYLSIRGYLDFTETENTYEDFLIQLQAPLIVDAKLINSNENCENPYQEVSTTYLPETEEGCRCDYSVYKKSTCKDIYSKMILKNINSEKWEENCERQDKLLEDSYSTRLLQSVINTDFSYLKVPESCRCYKEIPAITTNKTIDKWFLNSKICVLYDKTTSTEKYLKSAMNLNCTIDDTCQNYFCKDQFELKKCPGVNVYFDNNKISSSSTTEETFYEIDKNLWNIYLTPNYNQTYISNEEYEDTVLLPVIGVSFSRNGKCTNGENSLITDYELIDDIECSIDQSYYSIHKQSFKEVLKANNYLDTLVSNLPLFEMRLKDSNKWTLDLEYAFYRNTLTCLMKNFDTLNQNYYFGNIKNLNETQKLLYTNKKLKLQNIITVFIEFKSSYEFQGIIQISILTLNSFTVLVNFVMIFYKFIIHVKYNLEKIFDVEIYLSFFLDVTVAILGGVSYFILNSYVDFLENVIESGCIDNYVQYKFGVFSASLDATGGQNFQIFLIMLMKIFLLVFSMFFYCCARRNKMKCQDIKRVIKENLNEGEVGDENVEEVEKILKIKSKKDSVKTLNRSLAKQKFEEKLSNTQININFNPSPEEAVNKDNKNSNQSIKTEEKLKNNKLLKTKSFNEEIPRHDDDKKSDKNDKNGSIIDLDQIILNKNKES